MIVPYDKGLQLTPYDDQELRELVARVDERASTQQVLLRLKWLDKKTGQWIHEEGTVYRGANGLIWNPGNGGQPFAWPVPAVSYSCFAIEELAEHAAQGLTFLANQASAHIQNMSQHIGEQTYSAATAITNEASTLLNEAHQSAMLLIQKERESLEAEKRLHYQQYQVASSEIAVAREELKRSTNISQQEMESREAKLARAEEGLAKQKEKEETEQKEREKALLASVAKVEAEKFNDRICRIEKLISTPPTLTPPRDPVRRSQVTSQENGQRNFTPLSTQKFVPMVTKGSSPVAGDKFSPFAVSTWVESLQDESSTELLSLRLCNEYGVFGGSPLPKKLAFQLLRSWMNCCTEREDWAESSLRELGELLLRNLRNSANPPEVVAQVHSQLHANDHPEDVFGAALAKAVPRSGPLKKRFAPKKSGVECPFCKKKGHVENDCWLKNPDKKRKNGGGTH